MPIEFRCPSCNQQLRVPDTAGGKNAKCPKCATVVNVPAASAGGFPPPPPPPPGGQGGFGAPASSAPASSPFDFGQPSSPPKPQQPSPFNFGQPASPPGGAFGAPPGGAFGPPPPGGGFGAPAPNPFADAGQTGGGGFGAGPVNPYASPAAIMERPKIGSGEIRPTVVDVGPIMNWAFKVWQDNLGILVGCSFVYGVLLAVVAYGIAFVQIGIAIAVGGQPVLMFLSTIVVGTINTAWATFLLIGMTQICFKLARQQKVEFTELFGGGEKFLRVFGFQMIILLAQTVLNGVMQLCVAMLGDNPQGDAAIVPIVIMLTVGGIAVVAALVLSVIFWPIQYLLIDTNVPFGSVFGLAARVTQGNRLTTVVLALLSFGIMILGLLACFVGLLFAAPLVSMLWAVAYLMMAGEISTQPGYSTQGYQQPMYR